MCFPKSISPTKILVTVANITAPAEISFAIPTILENLLWKMESSVNSIAVLSISVTITCYITNKRTQNSNVENFNKVANISTINAIIMCIRILISLFTTRLKPFRAFLNVLWKPCDLNFVIFDIPKCFTLFFYNKIIFFFGLMVKP